VRGRTDAVKFTLIDHTDKVANLSILAVALQRQLREHVAPAWGLAPTDEVAAGAAEVDGACTVAILQDADQADALGYHDKTPNGAPYARVFLGPTLDAGLSISSVVSHEVIEARLDAACNLWADSERAGHEWAVEGCDAVQDESYDLGGYAVSDFVLPAFFDPGAKGPYDYAEKLSAPFSLTAGGYTILRVGGRAWQKTAESAMLADFDSLPAHKKHPAARSARRFAR
jgi:hypothetical protein